MALAGIKKHFIVCNCIHSQVTRLQRLCKQAPDWRRNYHHHIVDIVDRLSEGIRQRGGLTPIDIADIAQVLVASWPHAQTRKASTFLVRPPLCVALYANIRRHAELQPAVNQPRGQALWPEGVSHARKSPSQRKRV